VRQRGGLVGAELGDRAPLGHRGRRGEAFELTRRVDNPAARHAEQRLDGGDLVFRDGEVVVTQYHEVGVMAGPQQVLRILFPGECRSGRGAHRQGRLPAVQALGRDGLRVVEEPAVAAGEETLGGEFLEVGGGPGEVLSRAVEA
jgi:hypothetical protein